MILKIFVAVLVCTGCINLTFGVSKQERKNGETTTFLTSSEFNITKVWLRVLERDFITFKVRACSDVNVALLQFRFDEKVGLTRVVIGGWKNRRSVIRDPAGGGVEVAVWTPGILSCQEFRAFWISWRNETLKVGRGPVYNQNIFMQMSRTGGYAHKINDVGFSTGWGSSGTWTIRENVGVELFYTTPKTYSFSQLWKSALHSNGFLAFRAMACSDVHVAVARGTGVFRRQAYEFVFGGWSNTKSAIRTRLQGEIRAEVHFNDLLNCTEFRDLWVSWKDGLLAMGRGSVYMRDVLVTYNHTRPRQGLSGVGFSTGWGLDGVFSLNQDLEATYLVNTPPFDSGYRTWLLTPRASYVTFSVQVCRDAWVAVTHIPGVLGDFGAEIFIGKDGKTTGVILQATGAPEVEVSTPGVLSCDISREFWLSLANNTIRLGTGNVVDRNIILTWYAPGRIDQRYVRSLGFATRQGYSGQWRIRKDMGTVMELGTFGILGPEATFLTVRQEVFKVFWVAACANATIVLSQYPGVVTPDSYRVILGYNNQWTRIEWAGGSTQVATQGILKCRDSRPFWLSWIGGRISVGRGSRYHSNTIIESASLITHPVAALSLGTTGVSTDAFWVFEEDRGDMVTLNTTGTTDWGYKWFALNDGVDTVTLSVIACSDVYIGLASYHTHKEDMYEIRLDVGSKGNNWTISKGLNTAPKAWGSPPRYGLSCTERMALWIRWRGGKIQVGRTVVPGMATVVEWTDPTPYNIKGLAFRSGNNQRAEFRIMQNLGKEVTFDTLPKQSYEQFWLGIRHRTSLVFNVQACRSVLLLLCEISGHTDLNTCYNITIRDEFNQTLLRLGALGFAHAYVDTPYIVSCDESRDFWLSWFDGEVTLGKGRVPYRRIILHFQDLNPIPVTSLGISTGGGNVGKFRITFAGNTFASVTPPPSKSTSGFSTAETVAAVIGFLVLIGLFVLAVYVIIRPPEPLKPIITPFAVQRGPASVTQGFGNPLHSGGGSVAVQ